MQARLGDLLKWFDEVYWRVGVRSLSYERHVWGLWDSEDGWDGRHAAGINGLGLLSAACHVVNKPAIAELTSLPVQIGQICCYCELLVPLSDLLLVRLATSRSRYAAAIRSSRNCDRTTTSLKTAPVGFGYTCFMCHCHVE